MFNVKRVLIGGILAVILCCLMLTVSSLCVWKTGILNNRFAGTLGIFSGVTAVGVSSAVLARWVKERGMLHGMLLSIVFISVYFIVSMVYGFKTNLHTGVIRSISFLVSGALGGMLGVNGTQHIRF